MNARYLTLALVALVALLSSVSPASAGIFDDVAKAAQSAASSVEKSASASTPHYRPYESPYQRHLRLRRAVPALNKSVLAFAQGKFGQQVGRGECWDLAAQALIAAGARPANGYNFGTVVTSAKPGDIIQFYNARFETANSWFQMGSPNHTAVVESVNGNTIVILQQNVNGVRKVSRQTLDLGTKTQGSYTFFRPMAK